ncbi:MAG TPA: site-specific tyrosine recombinase/integron integrase [Bacteroidia bacterium]|jgi:integrase/recombinase XerD|nr:site-specific tyrosine recombinase/integron integrase [Bacteroidia bacterium]
MKTLALDITKHREAEDILLRYPNDKVLDEAIKKISGVRWTRTHTCWQVAYSVFTINQIKAIFDPICKIDATLLKEKIVSKKTNPSIVAVPATLVIGDDAKIKMKQFKDWLESRRYSKNTVVTYMDALKSFLRFYSQKPVAEITNEDVIIFNNEFVLKHKLSASYQSQVVNAIKLFFRTVQNTAIIVDDIHRPKKPFKLPLVLSLEDIESLLNSLENIKHKTMLALIYSAGLRRSELLNMEVRDVDSKRMMITVKAAKGNKDRVVPLSATILELLRIYYKKYSPKIYLFEGQTGNRYSETSLQEIFHQAKNKAKINKSATLHTLRHSYATHLLEGGTNLRYIQEILGHKSPKTTQIYTHVSNEGIGRVTSPIEKMKLNHAK